MKWFYCLSIASILALAGCGGSGSGSGTDNAPGKGEVEMGFDSLTATGFVNTEPVTANTELVKWVGLAGGFSQAQLRDTSPSLNETVLAFVTGNTSIFTVAPDGSSENLAVTDRNGYPYSMVFNTNASRIYYVANGFARWVPTLGGNYTDFLSPTRTHSMDLSPDGTKILTTDYNSALTQRDVWKSNLNGSGRVQLTNDAVIEENICWVNANTMAYDDGSRIYLRNIDGSNPRELVSAPGVLYRPDASPDGQWLAYVHRPESSSRWHVGISHLNIWGYGDGPATVDLGVNATSVAWAPDGKHLAAVGTDHRIYLVTIQGQVVSSFAPVGDQRGVADIAWGPFINSRSLIGTNGILGPRCNGIIFSQSGQDTKAVATFTATTASTAKIACDDQNTTGPTVVYTAEADRISRIAFNKDAQWRTEVILPLAGINGALISFDADTGMVSSVMTYAVSRSAKPKVTRQGDTVLVEGDIANVYDGTGKPLGPANKVSIDGQSRITLH